MRRNRNIRKARADWLTAMSGVALVYALGYFTARIAGLL